MSKKKEEESTEGETVDSLKAQIDELTKVLSALISDIDDHRNENCSSTYWWLQSFLKDLDISNKLKGKLGFPIDDDEEEDEWY